MKTYIFRDGPLLSERTLEQRVITAMTEMEIDGVDVQLQTLGMHPSDDQDGEMVLARVGGQPGWHYHNEALLIRHGLKCAYYLS